MKILDLIDPSKSDIPYKEIEFPDGQPHFQILDPKPLVESTPIVEVLCQVRRASDILELGLALDVLAAAMSRHHVDDEVRKLPVIHVSIAYMLGARMDRRINELQPFTLGVISRMVAAVTRNAHVVRVLDPHSPVTIASMADANAETRFTSIPPYALLAKSLEHFGKKATIVVPDEGAVSRTMTLLREVAPDAPVAYFSKKRDSQTGALSGFEMISGEVAGRPCLIVDDLCDGGGTFAGIADILKGRGAIRVGLCVTHGIFSKGLPIKNVDVVYTTDSFPSEAFKAYGTPERGIYADKTFASIGVKFGAGPYLFVYTDYLREHVRRQYETQE